MTDAALPILAPGVQLPAAVRNDTTNPAQRQNDYRAALAFERSLLLEMTKQLNKTAQSDEDENASAATKMYREQLPTILADSLISAGGIGIAASIDEAMHPKGAAA
jgi:Rod binding domain-containing protein